MKKIIMRRRIELECEDLLSQMEELMHEEHKMFDSPAKYQEWVYNNTYYDDVLDSINDFLEFFFNENEIIWEGKRLLCGEQLNLEQIFSFNKEIQTLIKKWELGEALTIMKKLNMEAA